jgi:tRNA(Leu) C34 or U34 (ribose-2'-O)-methylase TrmL
MKFIKRPSIDLYPGIRVDEHTDLEYHGEKVEQRVKDLVLHSVTTVSGEGFKSVLETTVQLQSGDILIFEEEGRGYIKPVETFMTVEEAIADLEVIKDMR